MLDSSENLIIKAYAADLLKNQISYLENQIEGLIYDENIEFLHHTRVMSRRIRNTISVFAPYFGKKNAKRWFVAFRKLTKSNIKLIICSAASLYGFSVLLYFASPNEILSCELSV